MKLIGTAHKLRIAKIVAENVRFNKVLLPNDPEALKIRG